MWLQWDRAVCIGVAETLELWESRDKLRWVHRGDTFLLTWRPWRNLYKSELDKTMVAFPGSGFTPSKYQTSSWSHPSWTLKGENEGCDQTQEGCQVSVDVNWGYVYDQDPRGYAGERILVLNQEKVREVLLTWDILLQQELRSRKRIQGNCSHMFS